MENYLHAGWSRPDCTVHMSASILVVTDSAVCGFLPSNLVVSSSDLIALKDLGRVMQSPYTPIHGNENITLTIYES